MIPEAMRNVILEHFAGLDIWQAWWEQSAIVLVGSSVLGVTDAFTDIDLLAFVPHHAYRTIYQGYRAAVHEGRIAVLNSNAFLYDEFPLVLIPTITGHYTVHAFEEVEEQVRHYDDITMWIHSNGHILHDPSGRYGQLQAHARSYPDAVWRAKVRTHFFHAYRAAIAASNPLRRGDRATVILTMTDCIAHLLRLCCLLEQRPFPYDKWLYREALQTQAGQDLHLLFESFFNEISRPVIQRSEPACYERPGHRNADLEAYPLHMIWRRAKSYFESKLPTEGSAEAC